MGRGQKRSKGERGEGKGSGAYKKKGKDHIATDSREKKRQRLRAKQEAKDQSQTMALYMNEKNNEKRPEMKEPPSSAPFRRRFWKIKGDSDGLRGQESRKSIVEKFVNPTEELKEERKQLGIKVRGVCPPPISELDDPHLPAQFREFFNGNYARHSKITKPSRNHTKHLPKHRLISTKDLVCSARWVGCGWGGVGEVRWIE